MEGESNPGKYAGVPRFMCKHHIKIWFSLWVGLVIWTGRLFHLKLSRFL